MIIDKLENTVVITQENLNIIELVKNIDSKYSQFEKNNLIINLNDLKKVSLDSLVEFLQLNNIHRANKHSFVLVSKSMDLNETPDELIVVPSLKEAHDIIEMEEMERDLGV